MNTSGLENSRLSGGKGQSYLLQRKIGQGNFACVYRCIDVNDPQRRRYACKVISKLSWDERARANLFREIGILREVHHENVLTMHDLLETPDLIFIVMPLFVACFFSSQLFRCGYIHVLFRTVWVEASCLRRSALRVTSQSLRLAKF